MYAVVYSKSMKRDAKRVCKRGYDMSALTKVIDLLTTGNPLPARYKDHALKGGKYKDCRECHIEDDWLLIYKRYDDALIIMATGTGTHSDLFKK